MSKRIIQLAKNHDSLTAKARAAIFTGGWASEKLDGVWVAARCVGGEVTFYSSTLEEYVSLNATEVEAAIQSLHIGSWSDFVLIAEAYLEGEEQAVISGICRKQERGYADDVELRVHDILTLEEWRAGKSTRTYEQRLNSLVALFAGRSGDSLSMIPQRWIENEEGFITFANEIQEHGGEGACYRHKGALWESGDRGTNLIRIKEKITYDLEVSRVGEVGTGEKGGLTGVLYVWWRQFGAVSGDREEIPVRGMKHDDLRAWAEDPSLIVGKIVEVHAMKFTNLGMLREPRFKSVREDKLEADL